MVPKPPRRISVDLDIIPFAPPDDSLDWVACIDCREPLELHQPDVHAPDGLLGICVGCGRWYLMLHAGGEADAVLVALPTKDWLRAVLDAQGPSATTDAPGP